MSLLWYNEKGLTKEINDTKTHHMSIRGRDFIAVF